MNAPRSTEPAACRCGTRESPSFDRACPEHGALTGRGSFDDRQVVNLVRVTCAACGRDFDMTIARPLCQECRASQEPHL